MVVCNHCGKFSYEAGGQSICCHCNRKISHDAERRPYLVCDNCDTTSEHHAGQFLSDRRWVCTEVCRKALAEKQSYDDLATSGGIVDAP